MADRASTLGAAENIRERLDVAGIDARVVDESRSLAVELIAPDLRGGFAVLAAGSADQVRAVLPDDGMSAEGARATAERLLHRRRLIWAAFVVGVLPGIAISAMKDARGRLVMLALLFLLPLATLPLAKSRGPIVLLACALAMKLCEGVLIAVRLTAARRLVSGALRPAV